MSGDDPEELDWASLILTARLDLGMSEAEFWRCTPRKFNALCMAAVRRKRR